MKVEIKDLTKDNQNEAMEVALEQEVGEKKEIVKFFDESFKENKKNIFVAVVDNQVVGLIGWYQDKDGPNKKLLGEIFPQGEDIYWVSFFAVSGRLRGQGIGTILMRKLFEVVKEKRASELWTYTRRARVFYEKMGFGWITQKIIDGEMHDFLKCEL